MPANVVVNGATWRMSSEGVGFNEELTDILAMCNFFQYPHDLIIFTLKKLNQKCKTVSSLSLSILSGVVLVKRTHDLKGQFDTFYVKFISFQHLQPGY